MFFRSNTRYPQPPASSWTPADITAEDGALVAWWKADAGCYDAQTGGSACDSGDIIYRWEDQSGRGVHLQTTTSSSVTAANRPVWLSPSYGLPFVRWNNYAAYGSIGASPKAIGASMYRDNVDFLNGKPGCSIVTVMRIKPLTFGQNYGTLNVLHGAPTLGQNYDHLSRIRADFNYRSPFTNTGGGVISMYQSRRYVWMKLTPDDDSVPSPYAYTHSPNSFTAPTRGSHSDQHDRRCWFIHGSAFDCATGYALHLHNARVLYTYLLKSGGYNGGAYPNVNSNRVLMNDGHWADYGQTIAAPIDIGEMIVLDRVPNPRLQRLIEGYLGHRWGIARSLYEAPTTANYSPRTRSDYHPFADRPGSITLPKPKSWTPMGYSSLRGYFDGDFSGRRNSVLAVTRWHNLAPNGGDAAQGNAVQTFTIGTGIKINGLNTVTMKKAFGSLPGTASNLRQGGANLAGASGCSVFVVLRPRSDTHGGGSDRRMMFEHISNTTSLYGVSFELYKAGFGSLPYSAARVCASRWLNANDTSRTLGTTDITFSNGTSGSAYLLVGVWDFANGTREVRVNGSSQTKTTGLTTGSLPTTGYGDIAIANDRSNAYTNGGCGGDYGELVWFREALSASDIEKVEGYLAWKWGFDAELPKAHAYADGPPT